MGKRGNKGWLHPQPFEVIAWEPSEWELLLKQLRIKDDQHAIEVLGKKTQTSFRLRVWVAKWCSSRYVPLKVLRVIGLEQAVNFRFD